MRVFGFVLLAAGAIFFLLFILAQAGGGNVGFMPFFVSFFLMYMGWALANSAKGLVPMTPASSESPTTEIAMTPETASAIERQGEKAWRQILVLAGAMLAFFVLLGIVLGVIDRRPGEGMVFVYLFGGIGLATAAFIAGISWFSVQRLVNRDVRGTNYLRTVGPVQVVPMLGGSILRLADRSFIAKGNTGLRELRALGHGTVDYTPRAHLILAAWDMQGRRVYASPGYDVENTASPYA